MSLESLQVVTGAIKEPVWGAVIPAAEKQDCSGKVQRLGGKALDQIQTDRLQFKRATSSSEDQAESKPQGRLGVLCLSVL